MIYLAAELANLLCYGLAAWMFYLDKWQGWAFLVCALCNMVVDYGRGNAK